MKNKIIILIKVTLFSAFLNCHMIYCSSVFAQRLEIYQAEDKSYTRAIYVGDMEWLIEQKDPASKLILNKEITELTIGYKKITPEGMKFLINNLGQLKYLELQEVEIDNETFSQITNFKNLESVTLTLENANDYHVQIASKIKNLKGLSMWLIPESKFPLTGESIKAIKEVKTLESLKLYVENNFDDNTLEELAKSLPKLESLLLSSDNFTDKALDIISLKMKLISLIIDSKNFTKEKIDEFQKHSKIVSLEINSKRYSDYPPRNYIQEIKLYPPPDSKEGK